QVTLANSRFKVTEWLVQKDASVPAEINLGPAVMSFEAARDEGSFLKGGGKRAPEKDPGTIVLTRNGKSHRARIVDALKGWMKMGDGLTLKAEKYFAYASVEKNQLVSKSDEPLNPAVTLLVRDASGNEEKHTIFALYPEFATMHKSHQSSATQVLGVSLKMVAKNARRANARGSLRFASVGDKLLFSTSTESSGYASNGVVKVGTSIPTGWMDLQFNVEKWIPQAVEARVPRYVDKVAGSDAGFVAAAHFKFRAPGRPEEEFWLYEGSEHVLPFTKNVVSAVLHRRTLGLPFQIQLDKFTIHHDPGTEKAAGYESQVTVRGEPGNQSARISMNEPLQYGGYTFYQASYQLQEGEAPISVFSVNFDPGRMVKYAGSLFLCLGILLMFYMNPHYWNVLLGAQRLSQKPFVGRGEPK
ncbi:MAG: cytochrome c biogenesis protein ResB, partial [Deltaproteobacteria bacterium]|nr:cytochrome c biogenesis protein ResB [Deltaproteobacteria bacterium]